MRVRQGQKRLMSLFFVKHHCSSLNIVDPNVTERHPAQTMPSAKHLFSFDNQERMVTRSVTFCAHFVAEAQQKSKKEAAF
jgi:hypothetical protein